MIRKASFLRIALCCAGLLIPASQSFSAKVTIDKGTEFQTIDGLGAYLTIADVKVQNGPFFVTQPKGPQYDTLATNLGASMVRMEISPAILPSEGAAYNFTTAGDGLDNTVTKYLTSLRELKKRGLTRVIGTVWSPPCWMKYTKQCANGGVLDPQYHDAYATYLKDFCKMIKDSLGYELYAISVQNEPQFAEPYSSAIMDSSAMATVIKSLNTRLSAAGLTTRVYGAEHMFFGGLEPYPKLVNDASVGLYAFAVHGYSDGIAADYGSNADWANLYNQCNTKGKKLWMTETTADALSLMNTAKTLHTGFTSGKISAWTWWSYNGNLLQPGSNTPRPSFYGSKHYFRFVRPGYKMIFCDSDVGSIYPSAFKSADGNTVSIVIINDGAANSVILSGSGLPTNFDKYESSSGKNCLKIGSVASNSTIELAANSVTTLSNADLAVGVKIPQSSSVSASAKVNRIHIYAMNGRLIRTFNNADIESALKWDCKDKSGKSVATGMYQAVMLDKKGNAIKSIALPISK